MRNFIKPEDVFAVLPTGCGKSLILCRKFVLVHDRGFSYPKAAIVVVIGPLNALIDSHILELKENPKTVNTRNIVSSKKPVTREKSESATTNGN